MELFRAAEESSEKMRFSCWLLLKSIRFLLRTENSFKFYAVSQLADAYGIRRLLGLRNFKSLTSYPKLFSYWASSLAATPACLGTKLVQQFWSGQEAATLNHFELFRVCNKIWLFFSSVVGNDFVAYASQLVWLFSYAPLCDCIRTPGGCHCKLQVATATFQ